MVHLTGRLLERQTDPLPCITLRLDRCTSRPAAPDQFAGLLPMCGLPHGFAPKYWTNSQYLPIYAVGGDRDGANSAVVRTLVAMDSAPVRSSDALSRISSRRPRRSTRLPLARGSQPCFGGLNLLRQRRVPLSELNLLPPAQFLPQPLVAPRPRRLALKRPTLLLHFENDVVDARQVLARRLEFQLRGAASRLYLVTPAASSINVCCSAGRDDRISPIFPCRSRHTP